MLRNSIKIPFPSSNEIKLESILTLSTKEKLFYNQIPILFCDLYKSHLKLINFTEFGSNVSNLIDFIINSFLSHENRPLNFIYYLPNLNIWISRHYYDKLRNLSNSF